MRYPAKSLVAELRRGAADAREAQAAKLYSPEALRTAMQDAAKLGFEVVTITGPAGLDLRETEAAKSAEKWLENQKIGERFVHRDGAAGLDAASAYDLVLSWKPTAEK